MTDLVFDPDVKVSEQALERKKKFRKTKQDVGIDAIMFDSLYPERKVYFDKNGEITCITSDRSYEPDPDWLSYDFTLSEIEMVCENVSASRFSVKRVDDTYQIVENKDREPLGISHGNDLLLVDVCDSADIMVEVKESDIIVTILTEEISDNEAKKVLPFYVTLPGNPHYMIYNFYVPVGDLTNKGSVKIPVDDNFTENSIYTKPVFGSYGRV